MSQQGMRTTTAAPQSCHSLVCFGLGRERTLHPCSNSTNQHQEISNSLGVISKIFHLHMVPAIEGAGKRKENLRKIIIETSGKKIR